jgi:hypothetical protein
VSTANLPWAGDSNVKCSVERTSDGMVIGTCTIKRPGVEPVVLTARASEREIAGWLANHYRLMTGQSVATASSAGLQDRVHNAAKQRVLRRLAAAYRRVKAQMNGTCPAAQQYAQRARRLLAKAKRGDATARTAIAGINARAAAGDATAKRDRRILLAVAGEHGASSGWTDVYSPAVTVGSVAYDTDTMDLENYYTISGSEVRTCQGCAPGAQCSGCASASAGAGDSDLIIGADGKAYVRGWDGAKWFWRQLVPHRTIRGEQAGFGIRDALLLGMRTVQSRELSASA